MLGWNKNGRTTGGQTKGRRYKDAICDVKNDCNSQNRVKLVDADQSSNTTYNVRGAKNALDAQEDSIVHTENKKSGWWSANFKDGTMRVESVKILNRPDGWGDRLGDSDVEIDGKLCAKVQSGTVQGKWYTVTCDKPVIGKKVKVISKENTPLHFAEIRVMGKANKQCSAETCTGTQFLLKSGRCAECPTNWIQNPLDKTNCIFGNYVKEIMCKRGHRVD